MSLLLWFFRSDWVAYGLFLLRQPSLWLLVRVFGFEDRLYFSADLALWFWFQNILSIFRQNSSFGVNSPSAGLLSRLLLLFFNGTLYLCIVLIAVLLLVILFVVQWGVWIGELISVLFLIALEQKPRSVLIGYILSFFLFAKSQAAPLPALLLWLFFSFGGQVQIVHLALQLHQFSL